MKQEFAQYLADYLKQEISNYPDEDGFMPSFENDTFFMETFNDALTSFEERKKVKIEFASTTKIILYH